MRYSAKLFGLVTLTVLMVPVGQVSGLSQTTEGLEQVQNAGALAQGERVDDLIAEADRLFNEFDQLWRTSQYQAAREKLQQALELYRHSAVRQAFPQASRQGEASALNGLGVVFDSVGQYEQALNYYQEALLISQDIGDLAGEAQTLNNIGNVNNLLGNYAVALEYYQQSLVTTQQIGDFAGEAIALNNIGVVNISLGNYAAALEYSQQSLLITQEISDLAGEAAALTNIGEVNRLSGNYPTALENYEQSLVISREIGDRSGEAGTLNNIGIVNNLLGNYSTALEYYEQSLVIKQEIGDRSGEAGTLNNIGEVNRLLGNYPTALNYYEQSLLIAQEIGDRAGEAQTLNNIGNVNKSLGNYSTALEYYKQSLLIAQEIGDRAGEAGSLNNIGNVNKLLGNYSTALEYYKQSLLITQEIGDRAGEAGSLNNIGNVNESLGNYVTALEYYQQSLVIMREIGSRRTEAGTLNNIGEVNRLLGNYPTALENYEQSLLITQEIGDRVGEAGTLNNIGLVNNLLGNYPMALEYYQQSLIIAHEIDDRATEAAALTNVGEVNRLLGNYPTALENYEQGLMITREIGDRATEAEILNNISIVNDLLGNHPMTLEYYQQSLVIKQETGDRAGEAATLNNIGSVNDSLGNYPTALEYYQQSLVITQEIGDRATEAQILSNMALLLYTQSQPELAIVFLKDAINEYEGIRDSNRTLDAALQESYTATIEEDYRILAELLLQQDRILEAQEVLDLLKLQELDDYLRDVRRGSDTPAQQLDFWPAEQAILNFYSQHLQTNSSFSFTDFINSPEVTQHVEQLRRTAQGQNLNPDQLVRLQDNLQQAGNAALLYPLILDDKIELVLVTTSGLVRQTVPVDRVELNRVITDFRADITNPGSDPTANAQKLYQWIIAPIAQQLAQANVETILYAADGALRYIPLAALHDGEQWLTQQYTINHITAASLTDFRRDLTTNLSILAGAFPADRGYSVEVNGESKFYQGLPAAEIEVETIQAEFPSTNALFDQQFNPDAVVPQLENYSIIHFATHAQFVSGLPHESFILFGNGERVTLRDIGEWSLPQTDLVVLSACETAVSGELGNGEEILGFGYQMQRIGVEAAIASLWQVSDGGTQVLMNTLYGSLQDGYSTAEALQQAQMALIEGDCFGTEDCDRSEPRGIAVIGIEPSQPSSVSANLSHPYYWAPFILIGNGL